MTELDHALRQLDFARMYTLRFLENLPDDDWFRQPREGVTHIAWQVGHLTMADYRLGMERVRGVRPQDEELFPERILSLFRGATIPEPNSAKYPAPKELRGYFKCVRAQMLSEVGKLPEEEWSKPLLVSHPIAKTKLEGLFWCAQHELVHAGQIALLRRLLGHRPLW